MSDPTEAAYDEPPGYEGEGHDGEDPVKQSLQSDPPRTGLQGKVSYDDKLLGLMGRPSSSWFCLEY